MIYCAEAGGCVCSFGMGRAHRDEESRACSLEVFVLTRPVIAFALSKRLHALTIGISEAQSILFGPNGLLLSSTERIFPESSRTFFLRNARLLHYPIINELFDLRRRQS